MRSRGRLKLLGLTMVALGALPVAGTSAATNEAAGWWSRTSSPAPLDPTAAKVEDGQLLVEGGPGGATAFAALRWVLDEGESAPTLTLTPLEGSIAPPELVLRACAVTKPWDEAAGGSFDDAPTYDCATAADGVVAEDGSSIELALAPLLQGTNLDVVLVPGDQSPPFSLKIDKAAATTLTTSAASSSGSFGGGGSSSFGSGTSSAPSSSGSSFSAPSTGSATFEAPSTPAAAPSAEVAAPGGDQTAAPAAVQPVATSGGGGDSNRVRNLGIAVLLAGLAVCGWAWIATSPGFAPAVASTEAAEGGRRFGRFARPVAES